MPDVAMMVLLPEQGTQGFQGHKRKTAFDQRLNFGSRVVLDCLKRAGHQVEFCSPSTAKRHKVVLVPLNAVTDMLSLMKQVGKRPDWQAGARSFTVILGGAGVVNPNPIRHLADYAVFDIDEDLPTWYLEGIASTETLRRSARALRRDLVNRKPWRASKR